jgi:ubiquinone/menaquinone biosynthesis C-methylase UbiE
MIVSLLDDIIWIGIGQMTALNAQQGNYDSCERYDRAHMRWLRFAGGEAQCAFEGAVTALLRPGMRALDVACGTGTVARRLLQGAQGDVDLVLLDASPNMLEKCREIPAQRILGCMENLPFEANSFDLLTCAWGIETLSEPSQAMREFIRVTRTNGHICLVYCADRAAQSIVGSALRGHISSTGRGRFLDHQAMRDLACSAGAKQVQTLHCNGPASAMILHV